MSFSQRFLDWVTRTFGHPEFVPVSAELTFAYQARMPRMATLEPIQFQVTLPRSATL